MERHWHAYVWTGHERPPDSERTNPANPTPPLEIAHWLRKPARLVVATYDDVAAYDWLKGELGENPKRPESEGGPPADVALKYALDCLDRRDDVVWGYWSATMRYVSRALIVCPRDGERCPTGS